MYFLFRFHHILPSQYRLLGIGEKRIIKTFVYRQYEDMRKEAESYG